MSDPFDSIEHFDQDGVAVWKNFFSEKIASGFAHDLTDIRRDLASGLLVRKARFVSGNLPVHLENLYLLDTLGQAARIWLDTPHVALYFSRLLLKDADWAGAVELHQDLPYFHGGNKISVFVPLAPTRADDGGLCFVKGSHKYGMLERGVIQRDKFPPMEDLRPDVEPGDVIFMDFLTWHYSEVGKSERPLMQITYQPATDGSYCGAPLLVSGEWQTEYFSPKDHCVVPDTV
jgi:hypothetical protein